MKISPFIVGQVSRSRLVRKLIVSSADSDSGAYSLGGQHLGSCMKVSTQMESLAKPKDSSMRTRADGFGWKYCPEVTILHDLDEYERGREGHRRTERELSLTPDVRDYILRNIGYSRKELLEAVRIVGKDK